MLQLSDIPPEWRGVLAIFLAHLVSRQADVAALRTQLGALAKRVLTLETWRTARTAALEVDRAK